MYIRLNVYLEFQNCHYRKQYVSIESYSSKIRKITAGIRKTSILGPILFLKYVVDLNKCMKHPKVYQIADDTNIPQFNASIIDLA